MNTQAVIARLRKFEGEVPYMYRCTGGEVTVGIGHAILSANDALKLNWLYGAAPPYVRPSDSMIITEWHNVDESPKGHIASYYQNLTQSRMAEAAISALVESDIPAYSAQLDRVVPGWTQFPEPAQEALFDMCFNLGAGGLAKFPKMLEACGRGDWQTAAAESHRNGIPDNRNQEIHDLFASCAE